MSLAVALGVHGDHRHRPHVTIGNHAASRREEFLEMSSFTMGGERGFVVIDLEEEDVVRTIGEHQDVELAQRWRRFP